MTRQEFSRKDRALIINRAKGKCQSCKVPFNGRVEVDHILPCSLGGDNSIANGRAICVKCHKKKTASDIKKTRKGDRQRDKNSGAWKPARNKMKSRGFSKPTKTPSIDKSVVDAVSIQNQTTLQRQYGER